MNKQNTDVVHPKLMATAELLKAAWADYSKYFNLLVPIMLVAGIGLYLQTIFTFAGTEDGGMSGLFAILALASLIVYAIGMIWGSAALILAITKSEQHMTVKQAYTVAKPYIWPLFLTGLLAGIFTGIGFILLIIPGIIVGVFLSFSYFVVFDENKKGMEALKASKAYVDNYFWAILGRLVVIILIVFIISVVLSIISNLLLGLTLGTLVQNVFSLVITPLVVVYEYHLYRNVKQVKGGSVAAPVQVTAESAEPTQPATPIV